MSSIETKGTTMASKHCKVARKCVLDFDHYCLFVSFDVVAYCSLALDLRIGLAWGCLDAASAYAMTIWAVAIPLGEATTRC